MPTVIEFFFFLSVAISFKLAAKHGSVHLEVGTLPALEVEGLALNHTESQPGDARSPVSAP